MISLADLYAVFTAMVPLYVAMFLAYASVKRWEIFTPEQCSGINRFVATFAIPFLAFNIISSTDPYKINLKFILADTMQKLLILFVLILWAKFTRWGSFNWMITLFSLSIMPNTLIIGIPLLRPMYGEECIGLLVQVVVLQLVVWCPIFLCLYELHAAKVTMNGKVRFTNDTNEGKEGDEMMNVEVIFKKKNTPADECPGDLAHSNEREVQGEVTHPRMTTTNLFLSVLSKVMKNPNTYGSVLGLIWGLISFRWNISMPKIIHKSVSILSVTGLGMAMFSLGLFMGSQRKIIACGKRKVILSMVVRFIFSSTVMAMCSIAIGIRGIALKTAIIQAALPQGVITFVYAKEYQVHEEVLSTAVILGMLVSLPVALIYNLLLGLT
ncbi:auxin efflux carrier component 7 isoform X2 [Amborella trichopoda]|nr:auxin efflux carrier component 7 isoform X2 [Amborella trichopoda]|eukprot:XP_006853071.2 auxin efflux carrier component 7 isoform X2 [Amborella trichopoda]